MFPDPSRDFRHHLFSVSLQKFLYSVLHKSEHHFLIYKKIGLNIYDENKTISPYLFNACLDVLFIDEIVFIATKTQQPNKESVKGPFLPD